MRQNFEASLQHVLRHEGGYVNHPRDPGGATNKGVTHRTYDAYRRARGLAPQSVRLISDAEVADIYKTRYWDVVQGDDLPGGVDYAVFDFAVNSGPSRATKFTQRIVGVDDDGQLGPLTLAAVQAQNAAQLVRDLCSARLAWLRRLSTWPTFGRGWGRRVEGVRDQALKMAAGLAPDIPSPQVPLPAPAIDDDTLEPWGWVPILSLWERFIRWLRGPPQTVEG